MTEQASFRLREYKGVPVIELAGEIDLTNADTLKTFIEDARLSDAQSLIVSLEKVSYFDSHMVGALADLSKRFGTNRRRLRIVAPRESPGGRILRTANLDLAIPLFETVEEAAFSS